MDERLLNELRTMRETLRQMEQRIYDLEREARSGSAPSLPPKSPAAVGTPPPRPSVSVAPPVPQPPRAPQRPCATHPSREVEWQCHDCRAPLCNACGGVAFQGRTYCQRCIAKADASVVRAPKQTAPAGDRETLETRIGRDWLNKIGITSLVLGVAFGILYSFQYFGPAMKIASGVAIALGLLGGGVWLERRPTMRWYARGLIGGGWALLYFTTYAMYHIRSVRLIDSPLLDLVLLFIVAAGAVRHSLRYQSETITALALSLGFLTTCFSDISGFTLASSTLLVVGLAWIVVQMRWTRLYRYGVVLAYVTQWLYLEPQIRFSRAVAVHTASATEAQFWLNTGFLTLYWLVYNAVLWFLDERERERRDALLTATLINAAGFVPMVLIGMQPLFQDARYLFLAAAGAAYALSEPSLRARGLATVATAHLLLGLSLMTLAIPLKLTGRWISFLWSVEVPLLVWLGLRYERWPYRIFAFGLSVVVFLRLLLIDLWNAAPVMVWQWAVPWRVLIEWVGIGSFGACAICYRLPRFRRILRPSEAHAFHLYFGAAAVLLWGLTALEGVPARLALAWAAEAAVIVLLGLQLADRGVRIMGTFGMGYTVLVSAILMWDRQSSSWVSAGVIGLLYGVAACYRLAPATMLPKAQATMVFRGYVMAASFLLWLFTLIEVRVDRLALAWALEAAGTVLLGRRLKDRPIEILGAVGMGLAALYAGAGLLSQHTDWWVSAAIVALLYGMSGYYRSLSEGDRAGDEGFWRDGYTAAGSVLLTMLLWVEVHAQWVSLAWAGEGLVLVIAGFLLRDKLFRISGLTVFGLLVLKILFVDLAGAETIYRILSFIGAGIMLLAASFGYTQFTAKRSKDTP